VTSVRQKNLELFRQVLNTTDGEKLMEELNEIWNPDILFADSPQELAYKAGLRDAFMLLKSLQSGEYINERRHHDGIPDFDE